MRHVKDVVALAILLCATANASHAQGTIQYLGSGSSSFFIDLGQAAVTLPDTMDSTSRHCYWTGLYSVALDGRFRDPTGKYFAATSGSAWIAWGTAAGGTCASPVAPFNVYAELSSDSMAGNRCFFMVDAGGHGGCGFFAVSPGPNPPSLPLPGNPVISGGACTTTSPCSLLGPQPTYNDTDLPAAVFYTVYGQPIFAAATDLRPEDAKFATARLFAPCGAPFARNPYLQNSYQTYGLGYQNGFSNTFYGTSIYNYPNPNSSYENNFWDFNISGIDPASGQSLAAAGRYPYTVSTVGAQPIIVVVSPNDGVPGRLASASDIMFSTLAEYFFGGYGRTSDLTGDAGNEHPVTTLIPEPVSGSYNTFEYSVPNSNEFKTSQDVNNCNGNVVNSNPLHIGSANGGIAGAFRQRALDTGGLMTKALQAATTDTIGYFFWNAANTSGFTAANGKYLTVNGVDPLLDSYGMSGGIAYTPGVLPKAGAVAPNPPLSAITFKNLNLGDYPIWSPLRIVSLSPTPPGVTALINAVQTLNSAQSDFIPLANLKVWKSHFNMYSMGITNNSNGMTVNPATPGDLCSLTASSPEAGGDVGAMTISIHGNKDFCTDYSSPIGINDKNQ